MSSPYLLTVRTPLPPSMLGALDDFEPVLVSASSSSSGEAVRHVYRVQTADQADLYGLLALLQRFGIELESVVAEDQPQ